MEPAPLRNPSTRFRESVRGKGGPLAHGIRPAKAAIVAPVQASTISRRKFRTFPDNAKRSNISNRKVYRPQRNFDAPTPMSFPATWARPERFPGVVIRTRTIPLFPSNVLLGYAVLKIALRSRFDRHPRVLAGAHGERSRVSMEPQDGRRCSKVPVIRPGSRRSPASVPSGRRTFAGKARLASNGCRSGRIRTFSLSLGGRYTHFVTPLPHPLTY